MRAGRVEYLARGILGVEALGPLALEVDRVRQNEIGVRGDRARRQEIANVAPRHVADPVVDVSLHVGGIRAEINHFQLVAEEIEHAIAQLPGVRDPELVGDIVLVRIVSVLDKEEWNIARKIFRNNFPKLHNII